MAILEQDPTAVVAAEKLVNFGQILLAVYSSKGTNKGAAQHAFI